MEKKSQRKWSSKFLLDHFNQTLFYLTLLLLPSQSIFAHGTVTSPPSRVWVCFQENPESPDSPACEAAIIGWGTQAFYDWSEVARMDANGMHRSIIQDGNLASAGRPDKFGGIDQVRGDWVATDVEAGPFQVIWTNSAPHQTLYYDVYITKADWTPDQPLTWDSLEKLVRTAPRAAAATDIIDVVLPPRTGKHVIYSVWQRSLTPEAFYSTSDVDFGNASVEPIAPIAAFTSENANRCGGSEVTFDASESFDGNGDTLTYTWDFGDGTTGTGVEITHTFPDGLDNATVELTVSDASFSSGATETVDLTEIPDCAELACPFGTPRESTMPTMYYRSYNKAQNGSITVIGENGPDLTKIRKLDIAYVNGEINTFFLNEWSSDQGFGGNGSNINPDVEHTFIESSPEITISNTGIENFDGSYYVNAIANESFGVNFADFVMVSKTGYFTIYFTYSESAPECDGGPVTPPPTATVDGGTLTGGPFTFTVGDGIADNVSGIALTGSIGDISQWLITDDAGIILGIPSTPESVNFDESGTGRCFIYNLSYNGTIAGLAIGNNISAITGDFDFSNSIDVIRNTDPDIPITFEDVVYDEEVDGDLSNENTAPTVIDLALGNNRVISGQTGTLDQANFFTFDIPEGYQLSQLIVDSYEGADDVGFIGIDEGAVISGQPANNSPSRLIGGLSYGTANIGTDILAAMGDLNNPAAPFIDGFGFTPPLPTGQYTVWLNQTGGASATVLNFVLTETETVTPPPPTGDCTFGTPLNTALPTTGYQPYTNIYVLGTGGPDMSSVTKFTVNWDLENNGLWQFSFDMNRSPWYANFTDNEYNFTDIYPGIFLSGTSIDGLDGYYYVTTHEGNFVMVSPDGYTLYFSNSAEAPDCENSSTGAKNLEELSFLTMFPNPAVTSISIQNKTDLKDSSIIITDLNGKEIKSLSVSESTTTEIIDISGIATGLYLVKIVDNDGFSRTLKLVVE